MASIVGFAGSLRSASYNAALLREAQQLAPEGDDLEIVSIAEIPM
jgi:NAD(P)H-dependent FMN reductase